MWKRLTLQSFLFPRMGRMGLTASQSTIYSGYTAVRYQSSKDTLSLRISEMMDSFGESRELIKDSMESAGSTYFSEDIEDAIAETTKTLNLWEGIKKDLEEAGDKETLQRLINENELKMKQLKEELEAAKHAGED